jgi:hypothetical protein
MDSFNSINLNKLVEILNFKENNNNKINEIFMTLIHDIKNTLTIISGNTIGFI